eukprot:g12342.t1
MILRLGSTCLAGFLFIINVFPLPGFGTLIAGLVACSCKTVLVAILQILLDALLIGWIWSILWGWELYRVAQGKRLPPPNAHVNTNV